MRSHVVVFGLFCSLLSFAQVCKPIKIKWVDTLAGDFSFVKNWSYPLGVEMKADGKAGCADGGFCPERCYSMLDDRGVVVKDSSKIFYQLLDTTHLFHSIKCEAWCYEWAGTDFIDVYRNSEGRALCSTATGIATHCSLELEIENNMCLAAVDLNSVVLNKNVTFPGKGGYITIDRKLWQKGIMKAEFNFDFENKSDPKKRVYWKGRIYSKINTI